MKEVEMPNCCNCHPGQADWMPLEQRSSPVMDWTFGRGMRLLLPLALISRSSLVDEDVEATVKLALSKSWVVWRSTTRILCSTSTTFRSVHLRVSFPTALLEKFTVAEVASRTLPVRVSPF